MRRAFSEILTQCASEDDHLAFITGDLGFQVFTEFQTNYPERFINAGVAEAQMINTAAGMALEGWHPVAYSIASFATARPFEQIRYCVAYPHLPVVLVGAGRGYTYSTSGVSHHAADDLGLMSILPGMTVVAPGDPAEMRQLFPQVLKLRAPAYFTVGRFGEPVYESESKDPIVLGKARLVRKGAGVAILSVAEMVHDAIKARENLEASGLTPSIYQFHTIKPLDTATLANLAQTHDALIIVEEHVPSGGLWSVVCQWAATTEEKKCRLIRLGPPDAFILGNPKREELRSRYGFDSVAIERQCRALMS